jgi:hypothetical protein
VGVYFVLVAGCWEGFSFFLFFFSFFSLAQSSSSTPSSSTALTIPQVSFEGAWLCDARVWSMFLQVADMCNFVVFVRDPRMDEAHRIESDVQKRREGVMRRKGGGVPGVSAQREGSVGPSRIYVVRTEQHIASSPAYTALWGVHGARRQCTEDATERRGGRVGGRAVVFVWLAHSSALVVISAHGLGVCAWCQCTEKGGGRDTRGVDQANSELFILVHFCFGGRNSLDSPVLKNPTTNTRIIKMKK